jgi:hypothetical protein
MEDIIVNNRLPSSKQGRGPLRAGKPRRNIPEVATSVSSTKNINNHSKMMLQ